MIYYTISDNSVSVVYPSSESYYNYVSGALAIPDTVYVTEEGIGDVDAINARICSSHGQIVVEGAEGNTVTLYDAAGRRLATRRNDLAALRFDVPASGTYLVKIGDYAALRVVVR